MRWIFLLGILISFNAYSQCKDYIIGVKGDTLNCTDVKGLRQGKWVIRYETLRGEPGFEEEGQYVDGKKEGIWRQYSLEGDLTAIEQYKWGNRDGLNQYFTKNGELIREESWRAVNPMNPYDTVDVPDWEKDPLGLIKTTKVVKLEGSSIKHGTWKYYQASTGFVVKEENWVLGEIAKGPGKKDDLLASDPEKKKEVTKPKEVLDFEKKNAGKKKIKVRDGRTGG